jgi:hypothetical protein
VHCLDSKVQMRIAQDSSGHYQVGRYGHV